MSLEENSLAILLMILGCKEESSPSTVLRYLAGDVTTDVEEQFGNVVSRRLIGGPNTEIILSIEYPKGKFDVFQQTEIANYIAGRWKCWINRYLELSFRECPELDIEDIEKLVSELINIGSIPKMTGGIGSELYFWQPKGEGIGPIEQWDARTREIGIELYKMGKGSIILLRHAHKCVVEALGAPAGSALSAHWNRIGEEECRIGNGDMWMH